MVRLWFKMKQTLYNGIGRIGQVEIIFWRSGRQQLSEFSRHLSKDFFVNTLKITLDAKR